MSHVQNGRGGVWRAGRRRWDEWESGYTTGWLEGVEFLLDDLCDVERGLRTLAEVREAWCAELEQFARRRWRAERP